MNAVLKIFRALKAYIKKEEKSQISNVTIQNLEKLKKTELNPNAAKE